MFLNLILNDFKFYVFVASIFKPPGYNLNSQVEVALEIASDQTVPEKWDLWSDRPRPKWPLIRRECARRSLCARSALEAASDQASSRPKWPLIRQVPDRCPDELQTIVQTKMRSKKSDQRMILNLNKSLNIVIIYSFHLSFYQSYIQLTKITNPEIIVNESKSKKKMIQKNYLVCHFFMLLTEKMSLNSSA